MLFLAQWIAPPLQPGPIRLPESAPLQRPGPQAPDDKPILNDDQAPEQPAAKPQTSPGHATPERSAPLPDVKGSSVYSARELRAILAGCSRNTPAETLRACAAALSARYVTDGYVNTRVYTVTAPPPGSLDVVEGRIAEIRIETANQPFARRVGRLLRSLHGSILPLPALDRQIQQLKSWPGIGTVQGSIGRLGSDPTLAVLTLKVEQRSDPLLGEISLRDDGNAGNGQWRAVAVALKNDLVTTGDTLLVYGEGDMDDTPELGAVITSLSYAYPLTDSVRLTGSFGYSRRNLVEGPLAPQQFAFRQFQGYGQLEWVFSESLNQRWFTFAGVSLNRNDAFKNGVPAPLLNAGVSTSNNTGFVRYGIGVNGIDQRSNWSLSLYGLQGVNGFSQSDQLVQMASVGVVPGQASALGITGALAYALAPNTSLNLRGAGQYAFNPLTPDMGFTLGSNTGLRGLPGQTISGDSGYLGTAEIVWTVWRRATTAIQLVPFIGYGGINTNRYTIKRGPLVFNNGIGAGGVMARFLSGPNWQLEVGWVEQINAHDQFDNAIWGSDYLIGRGLYTNLKYRF